MSLILQTMADGLVLGGIYALSAVGFSLIFGVLHVINLSHGVLVLLGAYMALGLASAFGIDPLVTVPLVMVVLFVVGYAYQDGLVRHTVNRTDLGSMLLTYGVALMGENALVWAFSPEIRSLSPSYAFASFNLGEVRLDVARVVALAASLVLLMFLMVVLKRTSLGRLIRATAQQNMGARLCGVNVRRIYALTFGISAAFAGASGILIGMVFPFAPSDLGRWTLTAFVVVTLGGVGSPAGALVGGLLLGLIYTFTAQYIGPSFPNATMFLMLVVMLLVRPSGLLGNAFQGSR